MYLNPLDIHYCQDSISNTFSSGANIGDVLDDVCDGRTPLSSFPKIAVNKKNSKWYTTDNRRLWVFRQLRRLGKCGEIPVVKTGSISSEKMTTNNDGVEIEVRGGIYGVWFWKPNGAGSNPNGTYACTWPENSVPVYLHSFKYDNDSDDSDSDGYL
ncbi:uncharacterized protein LOC132726747 [Ruditapes philippinarum]|uniref:uncharacterized protein LOC132726747 n=1 Tax=Ruditapes philippinarum TaxID=129788 RepID=UPI00295BF073|nr:uncharacterized protein LOC132726747 [Ruditapes philippinarum]